MGQMNGMNDNEEENEVIDCGGENQAETTSKQDTSN